MNTFTIKALVLFFTACTTCLFWTGVNAQPKCAALRPTPVKEQQEDGLKVDDENVVMCSEGKCEKLPLEDIRNAYPDTFSSQEDAVKRMGLQYNKFVTSVPTACRVTQAPALSSVRVCRFWSDNDRCCPTWRYVTFTNGPLTNIYNKRCYIIQLPYLRLYQYISVGLCGPWNRCRKCEQQYTIQSLLAWCPGTSGIRMHHFRIPAYCSCQP